jgi:hypothetical protein
MAHYRLYYLDSRSGKIERFEEFEACDDDDALGFIEQRIGDQPLELWSGGRKIGQFETALALSGVAAAGLWMRDEAPAPPPPARRLFSSFG